MVLVKDFIKDFYQVILNQRVLILVSLDSDALCACKILQYLLQCDDILYTIVPVSSWQSLETAFLENSEGIKFVILLNCGATVDIVEALEPAQNVVFFVCDSHRPVDVHNIYNQVQVKLLARHDEFDDVPEFSLVFSDQDENYKEDENDNSEEEESSKRHRFNPEVLEKRRERRLWEENRQKVLFEYSQFSSFGTSSSLLLFEMAWRLSKDTTDLLWYAIVGVNEQFLNKKILRDKYMEDVGDLQSHVARHSHRHDDEGGSTPSVDCLKISFSIELQLTLYRYWSLYQSIRHTSYTGSKFKVWTLKGEKRLHEFLADMGLPLVQCKQKFQSMDIKLKESIKETFTKQLDKYSLEESEVLLPSFHAHYGYRNKCCASDMVLACEALLETVDKNLSISDNFLCALDILSTWSRPQSLEKVLEAAKMQQHAIFNQVQNFIDMNKIISAGPFLYTFVQEGTSDCQYFCKPLCLSRLARHTQEAYCSISRSKRAKSLPLILGASKSSNQNDENSDEKFLIVGIPPLSDNSLRNFFGKAFEQASISTSVQASRSSFDDFSIEILKSDKSKFFDALVSLLE